MLKHNQHLRVKWALKTKRYYESLGYVFTHQGDEFEIPAEQLIPSSKRKYWLICDICGDEFQGVCASHNERIRNGLPDICPSCRTYEQHRAKRELVIPERLKDAQKICADKGYTPLTDAEERIGTRVLYRYLCPEHGEQVCLLENFLKGHGCYQCGRKISSQKQLNSREYVEQYINGINGNVLLNKEDYVGSRVHNLRILCGKCGKHVFTTSFSDYYNCGQTQCHSCASAESVGEHVIAEHLTELGIQYIREKKFKGCVDKRRLPFDFYLPAKNMVIEFDGPHHYYPVYSEEGYLHTQYHDQIKNDYCEQNGILILRIPYWDGHHIKEILNEALKAS